MWPNCVWEAARRNVPVVLIAGTMHATSRRQGLLTRRFLAHVHKYLAVQCAVTEADAARLRRLSGPNSRIVVTGDTRFDQVAARAGQFPETPLLPSLASWGEVRVVAGSTYAEDEAVLIPAFVALRRSFPSAKLILVPHEPTLAHLTMTETVCENAALQTARLSAVEAGADPNGADALLVDRVGLLARLYTLGDVAFVGGSFHARIHNVMEPAVLAKPVLFGPLMDNAPEAYGLLQQGGATQVQTSSQLAEALEMLARRPDIRERMGQAGQAFIQANLGAADKTLDVLRQLLLGGAT
jgi:3-deoxy-D-manno-octulosonic-acid transferase